MHASHSMLLCRIIYISYLISLTPRHFQSKLWGGSMNETVKSVDMTRRYNLLQTKLLAYAAK